MMLEIFFEELAYVPRGREQRPRLHICIESVLRFTAVKLRRVRNAPDALPNQRSLHLTIPDSEVDMLVLHCLHVEANGGDGGDHLPKLELVEHGGLPRVVQAQHDDASWGGGEEPVDQG